MDKMTLASQLGKALRFLSKRLTDDEAEAVQGIFEEWAPNTSYYADDIVSYGVNSVGDAQLYRVIQSHKSQSGWTPPVAGSLFRPFGVTDEGYPEWAQPVGAEDAYEKDDVVSHNGVLYKSTADNNVWAPDVYGWELYNE